MPRGPIFPGKIPAPFPAQVDALAAWQISLGDLALSCAGSYAADEGARLRELAALIAAAPEGQAAALPRPNADRLGALLGAGAPASAALELIGKGEAGYLMSCGGNDRHMASVILPGNTEEQTASGDTAALALAGALAMALAEQAAAAALALDRRAAPRPTPN